MRIFESVHESKNDSGRYFSRNTLNKLEVDLCAGFDVLFHLITSPAKCNPDDVGKPIRDLPFETKEGDACSILNKLTIRRMIFNNKVRPKNSLLHHTVDVSWEFHQVRGGIL